MLRYIKNQIPVRYKRLVLRLISPLYRRKAPLDESQRALQERSVRVSRAGTLDEVREIADEMGFTYFLDYDKQKLTKHREFLSAVKYFKLNVEGRTILDVGPGTADSLDCAKELGASRTMFIEEEPMFVRFAELKGHEGVTKNYTFMPYFPAEWAKNIDFIYTKGSINCDWVNSQQKMRQAGDASEYFDFDKWVTALLNLLEPTDGVIILVPAMPRQSERIIDLDYDLDTYYWCRDIEDYKNSFFCRTLMEHGFQVVESVQGFTHEKAFPLAFFYSNMKSQSPNHDGKS